MDLDNETNETQLLCGQNSTDPIDYIDTNFTDPDAIESNYSMVSDDNLLFPHPEPPPEGMEGFVYVLAGIFTVMALYVILVGVAKMIKGNRLEQGDENQAGVNAEESFV